MRPTLHEPGDTRSEPTPVGQCLPETVDEIIGRAEVDTATGRWWYQFGYQVGHAAGRAHAENDMAAHWATLAARVRAYTDLVDPITGEPRPGDHPGGMNPPRSTQGCAHNWPHQRSGWGCRGCGEVIP